MKKRTPEKKIMSRRETIRIGALWKKAFELGMAEREILCLQDEHSRQALAEAFGVSPGRISQIKAKAIRKMIHPFRRRLAIELGIAQRIGLTNEQIEAYKDRPIDPLPRDHHLRRKLEQDDSDEQ
ncbi:MAG: hypothetical protein KF715_02885 [Candidatus Didemnitutus sp.]|nr:hypothetical protein [Candidatus Didemnitutus sp.]